MITRRLLHWLASGLPLSGLSPLMARPQVSGNWQIATFQVDVTCPIGHPCMGGGISNAKEVVDPLECRGVVIRNGDLEKPVVIVSIDWCEIRNEAYDTFRDVLAKAANTTRERVILTAIHQHDTPIVDLYAEELLIKAGAKGSICMPDFFLKTITKVAEAIKQAEMQFQNLTHIGTGQAKVKGVASNRRFLMPDGSPSFSRTSATRDEYARSQPEGTIDPDLKTLSFWNENKPVAAFSFYSVHPMSYYGQGGVSWDFPGMARQARQKTMPGCLQIYVSGCSGNVTAGKYNDGSPANRKTLASRLESAMIEAFETTRRVPLKKSQFRSVKLRLEPRMSAGFSRLELTDRLRHDPKPFHQCLAAMGLSWLRREEDPNHTIDVPCLDFGSAAILLLPGESYVEFQLYAQSARPSDFICVAGYGESATGYVPTEKAMQENDTNLGDWCWVAPGSESRMKTAIRSALGL